MAGFSKEADENLWRLRTSSASLLLSRRIFSSRACSEEWKKDGSAEIALLQEAFAPMNTVEVVHLDLDVAQTSAALNLYFI